MAKTSKVMTSRFDGKCEKCGGFIAAGTVISYSFASKKASHVTCPATPEAPPPVVMVEVGSRVAALEAKLDALEAEQKVTWEAVAAAETAYLAPAKAAGYCANCKGYGYVSHYSSTFDCGCNGGKGLSEVLAANAEVKALYETYDALRAKSDSIRGSINAVEREVEVLTTAERGDKVQVFKGRKVPVGTVGVAKWVGEGNWGWQVGLAVEGQEKLVYIARGNVKVLERSSRRVNA